MTTALLTSALLLTLGFGAPAHGGCPSQGNPGGKNKGIAKEVFVKKLGCDTATVQDTAKARNSQPLPDSRLLVVDAHRPLAPRQLVTLDSAESGSAEVIATKDAAGFDPETANLPAALSITLRRPEAPLGRRTFRTRLVRTSRWSSRPEAVEILTCTYAGPLVLAQLPATATAPSQLLAGPGYDRATPLRPLELTQEAVLRLCGDRAPQVRAYAMLYNLHFQQADEVARLLDYYNRIAVAVK